MGMRAMNWRHALEQNWSNLRFGETKVVTEGGLHTFETQVYLGGLDPELIRVELFADVAGGGKPLQQEMTRGRQLVGANGYIYNAQVPATRLASDYTARVIPDGTGFVVPLEVPLILWQR
jgi:starch phosphorylase